MSDAEYVAAVRDAVFALYKVLLALDAADRGVPRDDEVVLSCLRDSYKKRQAAAKLVGSRLVEIARKQGAANPNTWGLSLRICLAGRGLGEPPVRFLPIQLWCARLEGLAERLSGPDSAAARPTGSVTTANPSPDTAGDTQAAILETDVAVDDRSGLLPSGGAVVEKAEATPDQSFTSPAPPPEGGWTPADGPAQWAKLFGVTVYTFKRWCKVGKIQHRKLSSKSYQVAVMEIPAKDQAKFRPAGLPPAK